MSSMMGWMRITRDEAIDVVRRNGGDIVAKKSMRSCESGSDLPAVLGSDKCEYYVFPSGEELVSYSTDEGMYIYVRLPEQETVIEHTSSGLGRRVLVGALVGAVVIGGIAWFVSRRKRRRRR